MSKIFQTGFLLLVLALLTAAVAAQDPPQGDPVIGARIYDAWYNVQDVNPPAGDHPLWSTQTANKRGGTPTWRCVSCHGWDYKGVDGAFAFGSPDYTGFPGVIGVVGMPDAEIRAWLNGTRNTNHDFSPYLSPNSLNHLVAFLRTRLVNADLMVDARSGVALGSRGQGADLYQERCADCHGAEGANINFGTANNPLFLGDLAVGNPTRFIHKTRFGQANSNMPAVDRLGWTLQDVADVLAYAQTLPLGDPGTTFAPDEPQLDFSQQGSTTSLVLGAILLLATIFGGTLITQWQERDPAQAIPDKK